MMEMIIQEQLDNISLLQNDIDSPDSTGSFIGKKHKGKADEQLNELDKQVEKLRKQIELQNKKNDALEVRASIAEKNIWELNSRLEDLLKVDYEQKTRLHKAERDLKVTKEEMLKAKSEAASMFKKLTEVKRELNPHWLVLHFCKIKSYMLIQWNKYLQPALDFTIEKALEKKVQLEKWLDLHIRTINTKCIPMMKEKWLAFTTHLQPQLCSLTCKTIKVCHSSVEHVLRILELVQPQLQSLPSKTIKVCHSSIDCILKTLELVQPQLRSLMSKSTNAYHSSMDHVFKTLDSVEPYIQGFGRFVEPFMNRVAIVIRFHSNKAYVMLMESANIYHQRVQQVLKNNKLTRSIASVELAWFLASALLVLPMVVFFKFYFAITSKSVKKGNRNSHRTHPYNRIRRRHHVKKCS